MLSRFVIRRSGASLTPAAGSDLETRAGAGRRLVDGLAALPLFCCSFRPLFLAAALQAGFGIALWLLFLNSGLLAPPVAGGPVAWHAHELVFGFGMAAVAGFVLTAAPEFTGTPAFAPRVALAATLLWLAGRAAFWASGLLGPWPALVANLALALALPALLARRILSDPSRRHVGFLAGLAALAIVVAGYHVTTVAGADPLRWARAGIGVMMMLIVVAMSRISMRIVNDALDFARARESDSIDRPVYLARPPRRKLAIVTIAAHTVAEFLLPGSAVAAWLALAAAAGTLNLLNDWHVGRPLFGRWPLLLYSVYWLMALGYAAIGFSGLGTGIAPSAGLHLLTVGAMGVSIFAVLCIAGRIHAGRPLETRPWPVVCAAALVVAALLRAGAGLPGAPVGTLHLVSGIAWSGAWAGYLLRMAGVLWGPRIDGRQGCDEAASMHDAG